MSTRTSVKKLRGCGIRRVAIVWLLYSALPAVTFGQCLISVGVEACFVDSVSGTLITNREVDATTELIMGNMIVQSVFLSGRSDSAGCVRAAWSGAIWSLPDSPCLHSCIRVHVDGYMPEELCLFLTWPICCEDGRLDFVFRLGTVRLTPDVTDVGDLPPAVPFTLELAQNYPNPFNPVTEIKFALPVAVDVRLEVFNVLGQKVATLVEQRLEAGEHSIIWDAGSQASGVYLYRLTAGEFVETKKMMLLK